MAGEGRPTGKAPDAEVGAPPRGHIDPAGAADHDDVWHCEVGAAFVGEHRGAGRGDTVSAWQ